MSRPDAGAVGWIDVAFKGEVAREEGEKLSCGGKLAGVAADDCIQGEGQLLHPRTLRRSRLLQGPLGLPVSKLRQPW